MASMLSLLDVLPRHERVDIGGEYPIDIFGVSGEDLGKILERFPDTFQQLTNSDSHPTRMHPGLMCAFIAACQRNGDGESLLGNDEIEARARYLGVGVQAKLIEAMARCTFPDGLGPFLRSYMSLSSAASEAIEVVVEVASGEHSTASRKMRRPSAQPDTPPSGS
jgi:hypothetical protein